MSLQLIKNTNAVHTLWCSKWYFLKLTENGIPIGRLTKIPSNLLAMGLAHPNARLCDISWMAEIKKNKLNFHSVRFQFLTAVTMKIIVFWDTIPCSLVPRYQVSATATATIFLTHNTSHYYIGDNSLIRSTHKGENALWQNHFEVITSCLPLCIFTLMEDTFDDLLHAFPISNSCNDRFREVVLEVGNQ